MRWRLRHEGIHVGHARSLIGRDGIVGQWIVRIPQLDFPVGKSAILPELAVTRLFEQTTHHCLVIAVGHAVVIFTLLVDFRNVVLRQRILIVTQLVVPVCKVAAGPTLATQAFDEVLTHRSFELSVERREACLDRPDYL